MAVFFHQARHTSKKKAGQQKSGTARLLQPHEHPVDAILVTESLAATSTYRNMSECGQHIGVRRMHGVWTTECIQICIRRMHGVWTAHRCTSHRCHHDDRRGNIVGMAIGVQAIGVQAIGVHHRCHNFDFGNIRRGNAFFVFGGFVRKSYRMFEGFVKYFFLILSARRFEASRGQKLAERRFEILKQTL